MHQWRAGFGENLRVDPVFEFQWASDLVLFFTNKLDLKTQRGETGLIFV